jgi:hypothetical protein
MRTPSKEFMERLKNCDIYQHIIHTKKPDFSKLNKICKEFEESILEAQEAYRKNILVPDETSSQALRAGV